MSQEQFDKILGLINKGVEEGAKLETGGKRHGAPRAICSVLIWISLLCKLSVLWWYKGAGSQCIFVGRMKWPS